eukprot:scaffold180422_cov23-Tisochrysis_lutea.AAC.2
MVKTREAGGVTSMASGTAAPTLKPMGARKGRAAGKDPSPSTDLACTSGGSSAWCNGAPAWMSSESLRTLGLPAERKDSGKTGRPCTYGKPAVAASDGPIVRGEEAEAASTRQSSCSACLSHRPLDGLSAARIVAGATAPPAVSIVSSVGVRTAAVGSRAAAGGVIERPTTSDSSDERRSSGCAASAWCTASEAC